MGALEITLIVLLALAAVGIIARAIWRRAKGRPSGCGCGCGCEGCPHGCACGRGAEANDRQP